MFISRLIAPIAAKHGAQRRLNTRKEYAATGVIAPASVPQISAPSSATSLNPYKIPKVPTTFSFATSPVIAATAAFQSPQPSGAKIHATAEPIAARILLFISSTIPKLPPSTPKLCANHTKMVERRIIVPAFLMKDHPRSHVLLRTFPTVGRWYAGSSITNGAGSPANIFVFFKIIPEQIIAAIPTKYALGATHAAPSNKAPAIKAIIGSFAPQGINVVVIIVILRSLSFSIVLEAITPGTPHPVPISIGMKDLPDKPNLRKIRSIINAIRAIYPHPSRNARKRNSTSICGTNPRTAPTPPITPSTISPVSQSAHPTDSKAPCAAGRIHSPNNVSLVQSVRIEPTVVTDT